MNKKKKINYDGWELKFFDKSKNFNNYFTKINEIYELGIKDLVAGNHYTNKELCKKN